MNISTASKNIFAVAFFTLLAVNILIAVVFLFFKPLDPDEFQHVHIAWNIFFNDKVIYRDFWEHHGVIYAAVNTLFFKIFNLQADFSTFYFFRAISFCYYAIVLFLTYKIARVTFKDAFIAFLSVAILSSLYFFLLKGLEIRPDTLQNVFWLGGLYVLIVHIKKTEGYGFLLAGLLFGLAVATNTKALFGIGVAGLFLLLDLLLSRGQRKEKLEGLVKMGIGALLVFVPIVIYFISAGALSDLYLSTAVFNFVEITRENNYWAFPIFWRIFTEDQIPFVISSFLGIFLLAKDLFARFNKEQAFFLFTTVGCSSGALIGLFSQFYLLFLPLLSITSAFALHKAMRLFEKKEAMRLAVGLLLLCLFFIPMEKFLLFEVAQMRENTQHSALRKMFVGHITIENQRKITNYMLAAADRKEPIGYFWNSCGGFTFNEDVQYYWSYSLLHAETSKAMTGADAYGEEYVQTLRDKDVEYIIALPEEFRLLYPEETKKYINENYRYASLCILKRNDLLPENL